MHRTVRLFFSKTGRARYISHLDITRVFSRAIAKAALPVWYTQGFNPRIHLAFALPLSLGYRGDCEAVDIRVTDPDIEPAQLVERLNAALPQDVQISCAALPELEPNMISLADYQVEIEHTDPAALNERLLEFCGQPTIEVQKKTKKGERTIDLKPLVKVLGAEQNGNELLLELRLPAGSNLNVSPSLFLDAFFAYAGLADPYTRIARRALLTENAEPWR